MSCQSSPEGRTTIHLLQLNSDEHMAERQRAAANSRGSVSQKELISDSGQPAFTINRFDLALAVSG